ncbi:hypothetical protein [Desulfofustis limnaeus]|uniref:DUF3955 domain-containing protein n=1 Tax=Desulfofustis limnaeus TaxID=2740163 RepID=A0ABM7W4W4_9BACT|nr:hypothetical protein [Desulfofustis limnaeus]BDD85944.1 hypothetical protein DPPLL_03090 [Desulfofustis limnaeus]
MKNIIHNVIVILLSGIGIFFIVSGVHQRSAILGDGPALWQFDPMMIGIGTAIIVSAVLLYKNVACKSNEP